MTVSMSPKPLPPRRKSAAYRSTTDIVEIILGEPQRGTDDVLIFGAVALAQIEMVGAERGCVR